MATTSGPRGEHILIDHTITEERKLTRQVPYSDIVLYVPFFMLSEFERSEEDLRKLLTRSNIYGP